MEKIKRQIPNFITLCNLLCGVIACWQAVQGRLQYAAIFMLFGIVFDFFDGLVARLLKVASPMGKELDSLADLISFGASPRASISLAMAAKAYAFIKRRGYVIPEDVRAVSAEVLRHRIGLTYEAEAENVTTENIISEVLNAVMVP